MIVDEEVYLEHFGVKGMRWGVRKNTDTKSTKVGMTPDQAFLAAYGAGIALAVLVQIGRHRADSGRKDAKKTGDKEFKQNPKLKSKMTINQLQSNVVAHINPDYGAPGTKMNCRRATMAYEMRRRGYDVQATKSSFASGQGQKGLKKAIGKNQKFDSPWGETQVGTPRDFVKLPAIKKAEEVFASLAKYPEGARGEIGAAWLMGGGHSMAFEIVKGKPVIFDTQNGKVYPSAKAFSEFTPTTYSVSHTRLDDKPLDQEFLKRWVTDVQ